MKVSMNGFRRGLSSEIQILRDIIEDVVSDDKNYDDEDLRDALNDVICRSNALNCIYNKDDPDFIEMPDVEVKLLEA